MFDLGSHEYQLETFYIEFNNLSKYVNLVCILLVFSKQKKKNSCFMMLSVLFLSQSQVAMNGIPMSLRIDLELLKAARWLGTTRQSFLGAPGLSRRNYMG